MYAKSGAADSKAIIPALAETLGITTAGVQYHLHKKGYSAPYDDMDRALRILETRPKFAAKLKRSRPALMKRFPPSAPQAKDTKETKRTELAKEQKKPLRSAAVERARVKKLKAHWAKRLIRRLQALLQANKRGLSLPASKRLAVKILREGNYPGPRWDDEARALAIFRQAGIDISKFEYLEPQVPQNGGAPNGHAVVLAKPQQLTTIPQQQAPEAIAVLSPMIQWKLAGAEEGEMNLKQFESAVVEMIRNRQLNGIPYPFDIAFNALNRMRRPPPRK